MLIIKNDLIILLYICHILFAHHIFCIHILRCAWMEWGQQKMPACYHWTCESGTIYGLAVSGPWPPSFLFGVLFFSASFVSFLEAKVCSGLARLNRSVTCVTQRWDPGPLRGRSLLLDHLDRNSEADKGWWFFFWTKNILISVILSSNHNWTYLDSRVVQW